MALPRSPKSRNRNSPLEKKKKRKHPGCTHEDRTGIERRARGWTWVKLPFLGDFLERQFTSATTSNRIRPQGAAPLTYGSLPAHIGTRGDGNRICVSSNPGTWDHEAQKGISILHQRYPQMRPLCPCVSDAVVSGDNARAAWDVIGASHTRQLCPDLAAHSQVPATCFCRGIARDPACTKYTCQYCRSPRKQASEFRCRMQADQTGKNDFRTCACCITDGGGLTCPAIPIFIDCAAVVAEGGKFAVFTPYPMSP